MQSVQSRPKEQKEYTYADYLTWPDEPRVELIDGVIYELAAPTPVHQRIAGRLYAKLDAFLDGKPCVPFMSPIDVRFTESKRAKDVVQPDVVVICDHKKIRSGGIVGVPDLIVEVLSPSSTFHDFERKRHKYQQYGVKEYWIISTTNRSIVQYKLVDGEYECEEIKQGQIESFAIEGFGVDIAELFSVLDGLE